MERNNMDQISFILRELELLREEQRANYESLKKDLCSLRQMIEAELYGNPGHNGLKAQVSKNTEFRLNFYKYRFAIYTALATGLVSLLVAALRAILGF